MLKIKLALVGKKKQPEYRIVVTEHTKDPYGNHKEILGNYNPRTNPSTLTLKKERVEYWLSVGAQPTDTVHNLFVAEGLIKGDKRAVVSISKKRQAKLDEKAEAAKEAKATEEAPKEAQDSPEETPTEEPAEPTAEAPKETEAANE